MVPSPSSICLRRLNAFCPFLYPLKGNPKALRAAPGIDSNNNGPVRVSFGRGGTRQPDRHRPSSICIPRKVMGVLFWFIFVSVQVSQWLTMALTIFMEIMQ